MLPPASPIARGPMVSMVETFTPAQNDEVMDAEAPKSEPVLEGSPSSSVSTPEAEAETLAQDVAQTQKRKGGRKPVRCPAVTISAISVLTTGPCLRSTLPPKSASNGTDRPRPRFGSGVPSTFGSSSQPSSAMRTPCRPCSRTTAALPMSV